MAQSRSNSSSGGRGAAKSQPAKGEPAKAAAKPAVGPDHEADEQEIGDAVEVDPRTGAGDPEMPEKVVEETVHPHHETALVANGAELNSGGGGVPDDVQSATVNPLPQDQIKATGGTVTGEPNAAPLTAPGARKVEPGEAPPKVALTPAAAQTLHHSHGGFVDDDGKKIDLSKAVDKVDGSDSVVVTTKRVYETFPLPGAPDVTGQRLLFGEGVEMAKARFDMLVADSKARSEG